MIYAKSSTTFSAVYFHFIPMVLISSQKANVNCADWADLLEIEIKMIHCVLLWLWLERCMEVWFISGKKNNPLMLY